MLMNYLEEILPIGWNTQMKETFGMTIYFL